MFFGCSELKSVFLLQGHDSVYNVSFQVLIISVRITVDFQNFVVTVMV